jgi:hypothetical protein
VILDVSRVMAAGEDVGGGLHVAPDLTVADRFAALGTWTLSP